MDASFIFIISLFQRKANVQRHQIVHCCLYLDDRLRKLFFLLHKKELFCHPLLSNDVEIEFFWSHCRALF